MAAADRQRRFAELQRATVLRCEPQARRPSALARHAALVDRGLAIHLVASSASAGPHAFADHGMGGTAPQRSAARGVFVTAQIVTAGPALGRPTPSC